MRKMEVIALLIVSLHAFGRIDFAYSSSPITYVDKLNDLLKKEVKKQYHADDVSLTGPIQWARGSIPNLLGEVSLVGDDSKGNLQFIVIDKETGNSNEGWVGFSAWVSANVAVRRLRPGEALSADAFVAKKINISTGQGHEFRGVIFPEKRDLAGLEAIQTILEGQFLVTSAVQKKPDIHRGDAVRIHLISDELVLMTLGIAEEPGYLTQQIRVMTGKGKRELLGLLRPGGVVEVPL